jgi:twitching motility protein PilI
MAIRRRNLKEFQMRLTERINNASATSKNTRLGVLINEQKCLVDLEEAGEILSIPTTTTRVPGTQSWFKGLVSHRGVLIGVADLAQFSGLPGSRVGKDSRLLTLNQRLGLNAAILVSRMLGLQNLAQMKSIESKESQSWEGSSWMDERGDTWREIKLSALAGDQKFLSVAA